MQPTRYAIRYTIYDIRYTSYANRRNTPNSATTPNKPPVQPKLSTNYDLIMQNKANFRKAQMNVNKVLTREYGNETRGGSGKNKANSKPNKANLLKAKMNVNKVLTKDYENKRLGRLRENKPNTNPIQTQTKPIKANQSQFPRPTRRNKPNTNPIKPNFKGKKCCLV